MPPRKNGKREEVRVSLLPEETKAAPSAVLTRLTRALVVILVALVIALGAVTWYLRSAARTARSATVAQTTALTRLMAEAAEAQDQAKAVGNLGQLAGLAKSALQAHIAGEGLLNLLESSTASGVVFDRLAADTKGTMILSGRAQDFAALVQQVVTWHQNSALEEVRVSGITTVIDKVGQVEGVDFNVTLKFKPEVTRWQIKT